MGRPVKNSLDYFSMDTNIFSDLKIRRIMRVHGFTGFMVYVLLICLIYENEGYYIKRTGDLDEEIIYMLDGKDQPDIETLNAVIDDLAKFGLFDNELYCKNHILTSKRIQEQFVYGTKKRKRVEINPDYWLLSEREITDITEKSPVLDELNDTIDESVVSVGINSAEASKSEHKSTNRNRNINVNVNLNEKNTSSQKPSVSNDSFSFDYEKFQTHWNSTTHGMPKIMKLSDTRKKAIQRRVKEVGEDEFYRIVDIALTNPFLNGENDRGWTADFTWVMKPENFLKIAEGSYNRTPKRQTKPVDEAGDFLDEELRKIASGRNDLFDFEVVE